MSTAAAIAFGLILIAMWAIVCRVKEMQHMVTRLRVFAHHAAIGMALVCALVLPSDWAVVALAAGIVVQLMISSKRWRTGAPPGTRKDRVQEVGKRRS